MKWRFLIIVALASAAFGQTTRPAEPDWQSMDRKTLEATASKYFHATSELVQENKKLKAQLERPTTQPTKIMTGPYEQRAREKAKWYKTKDGQDLIRRAAKIDKEVSDYIAGNPALTANVKKAMLEGEPCIGMETKALELFGTLRTRKESENRIESYFTSTINDSYPSDGRPRLVTISNGKVYEISRPDKYSKN